jgi:DNA repair ATPase RecN
VEIEENMKEQKKLVGEMRVQLQSLQNSRVNHKDVLVRHENHTKKLIELVNEISEKQTKFEMERSRMEDIEARRFSTFEAQGRRTRSENLYDFDDGASGRGSSRRGERRRSSSGSRRRSKF